MAGPGRQQARPALLCQRFICTAQPSFNSKSSPFQSSVKPHKCNPLGKMTAIPHCRSQAQGIRLGQPCYADTAPVQQGPALTAAATRHPLTPTPMAKPGVRVVTYNILADQYASREHAQKVLFGYCPKRCGAVYLADCANALPFDNGLPPFR